MTYETHWEDILVMVAPREGFRDWYEQNPDCWVAARIPVAMGKAISNRAVDEWLNRFQTEVEKDGFVYGQSRVNFWLQGRDSAGKVLPEATFSMVVKGIYADKVREYHAYRDQAGLDWWVDPRKHLA